MIPMALVLVCLDASGFTQADEAVQARKVLQQACDNILSRDKQAASEYELFRIALAQADAGDMEGALKTASRRETEGRNWIIYKHISKAQAKAGLLDPALKIVELLKPDQVESARGSVLLEYGLAEARRGNIKSAQEVVPRLRFGKSQVLAEVAAKQAASGDAKSGRNTFKQAMKFAFAGTSDWNKMNAVSTAALAYLKAGDRALIERAAGRLLKASEGFSNPYHRFYAVNECAMIQALTDNRELASKNFSRAVELAEGDGDKLTKVAANMGKAGFPDRALDVIRSISGLAKKEYALVDLASALTEAGEYAQAIRICDMVQTYHRSSDPVLLKIVKYQLAQGKVEDSLDTCNHISNLAHKGEAMLMVATAQAKTGDRKQARDIVKCC